VCVYVYGGKSSNFSYSSSSALQTDDDINENINK
jgi:hypothetical protein